MQYCLRCACGRLSIYARAGGNPPRCVCGRQLRGTEEVYKDQPEFVPPKRPGAEPEAPAEQPAQEPEKETGAPAGPEQQPEPPKPEPPEPEAPAPQKRTVLRHVLVTGDGRRFVIGEGTVTVGRSGLCAAYLLPFPDVSRYHFRITPRRSGICAMLEDVSMNGTYVNGVRVKKNDAQPIQNGSRLRLASGATLTYVIEEETYND